METRDSNFDTFVDADECGASQTPGTTPLPETPSRKPRTSYIARHWRGDFSLARSYWVNTVAISLLYAVVSTSLVKAIDPTIAPKAFALGIISVWFLAFLVIPWQLVGLWRSAKNHIKRTRKVFWPRIVQVLVVLATINAFGLYLNTAAPQISEMAKIFVGHDSIGPYTLRLLRNGTEIEVSGGIRFGLTAAVRRYLARYPHIQIIHLNSYGGRIVEGRKLAQLIASRGLTTYTSRGCYSACTDAFLGGKERVLNWNARLGFHRPFYPGIHGRELDLQIQVERNFLLSRGIDPGFVKKALSTPHTNLWMPTKYELLHSKVITRFSDGFDFAMTEIAYPPTSNEIEKTLLLAPAYRALKIYHPDTYKRLLTAIRKAIQRGDSGGEVVSRIRTTLSQVYRTALPYASDDALLASGRVMLREVREIGRKSADACYAYVFAEQAGDIDFDRFLSAATKKAEFAAIARVIESAATNPQAFPAAPDASAAKWIFAKLQRQYGDAIAVLRHLRSPTVDKRKACELAIAYYSDVFELPKSRRVKMLRYLLVAK